MSKPMLKLTSTYEYPGGEFTVVTSLPDVSFEHFDEVRRMTTARHASALAELSDYRDNETPSGPKF